MLTPLSIMLKVNAAFYPASSKIKSKKYEEDIAREQANTRNIYRRSGLKGLWRHFIDSSYKKNGILNYCANLYFHSLLG